MSENKRGNNRAFAITMILVVPVVLFLLFFLYTKQSSHDLRNSDFPRKMYPMGTDTVNLNGNITVDSIYHTISDFAFTNQFGQTVTQDDVRGKIFVADFFFTSCPTICPRMTEQLVRVQEEFIRDDKVIIVSHTVDPKRDSVERLKKYSDEYTMIPGKWHLLTGDKAELYDQARASYKLAAADESVSDIEDDFVHTERFVLVDPDMNIRGYYYGTEEKDVNRLMGDIVLLLKEYKRDD